MHWPREIVPWSKCLVCSRWPGGRGSDLETQCPKASFLGLVRHASIYRSSWSRLAIFFLFIRLFICVYDTYLCMLFVSMLFTGHGGLVLCACYIVVCMLFTGHHMVLSSSSTCILKSQCPRTFTISSHYRAYF